MQFFLFAIFFIEINKYWCYNERQVVNGRKDTV